MRRLLRAVIVSTIILALAGCTSASPATSITSTKTPSTTTTASAPTPTPAPTRVTASVDTVVVEEEGVNTKTVALTDGAGVLALLSHLFGSTPAGTRDAPDATYQFQQTYYDWDGVRLTVPDGEGRSSLAVTAPELNGVTLRTTGDIHVGMTRAEALAAGAVVSSPYDGDGDGLPDTLQIDTRPAPGTTSRATPGTVGSDFVLILMSGDTVTSIQTGGNDYSDL